MSEELIGVIGKLLEKSERKILLLVCDGLGGLPMETGGDTELEAASTPHLDALARTSSCGLLEPVGPGITPGSGPAHMAPRNRAPGAPATNERRRLPEETPPCSRTDSRGASPSGGPQITTR